MEKNIAAYSDIIDILEILDSFETIKHRVFDYLRKETLTPSDLAQITKQIIDYPTLVTTTYPNSWTLLHLAAQFGHNDILETLINAEANTLKTILA